MRVSRLLIAAGVAATAYVAAERLSRFQIAEASMSPTLHPGDLVLTWRTERAPKRGDIVVFEDPTRPDFWMVKRVIGLPGEQIDLRDGKVFIDGERLHEPWTVDDTGPDGFWHLGSDEVFVLGDARRLSTGDSRQVGPLPLSSLSQKVVFRYWPNPTPLP